MKGWRWLGREGKKTRLESVPLDWLCRWEVCRGRLAVEGNKKTWTVPCVHGGVRSSSMINFVASPRECLFSVLVISIGMGSSRVLSRLTVACAQKLPKSFVQRCGHGGTAYRESYRERTGLSITFPYVFGRSVASRVPPRVPSLLGWGIEPVRFFFLVLHATWSSVVRGRSGGIIRVCQFRSRFWARFGAQHGPYPRFGDPPYPRLHAAQAF